MLPLRKAPRRRSAGGKVILENEKVRVIEHLSKPRLGVCGVGLHSHPPHLTICLTDVRARITAPGKDPRIGENKAGDVFWDKGGSHVIENIGNRDSRLYLVETEGWRLSIEATLQRYAKRLVRIAAQRWAPTLAFVALGSCVEASRAWANGGTWISFVSGDTLSDGLWLAILGSFAAAVGTALAAALPWSGWRSATASVFITLTCVGGCLWLSFLLRGGVPYDSVTRGLVLSNAAFALRAFWWLSMSGLLFSMFCAAREREAEMLAAARNAELERANTQRDLLESRLQVVQAQVDPTLLFDGLADVHRLYRINSSTAAARLDELIAYLRAALPKTRA